MTNEHRGARYYDLAHWNPISDTDTDSDLWGGLEGYDFLAGTRGVVPTQRVGTLCHSPGVPTPDPDPSGRFIMATESKQIDGVVDDPENGGLKSGPCLIAGFHALSCTSPSYYNPYRGVNKNTLSVDMVRLSLTFKGDRGEWLSRQDQT